LIPLSQSDPIKHVVPLVLENHSFDQMLGCFQGLFSEAMASIIDVQGRAVDDRAARTKTKPLLMSALGGKLTFASRSLRRQEFFGHQENLGRTKRAFTGRRAVHNDGFDLVA
jgi:phospholipase C